MLGQGGMGAVYLAEHLKMKRQVALKVIHGNLLDRPDARSRFEQEVRSAARLQHPNIVQAFDADEAGGLHFLVMEFVEGTDMARSLEREGPPPVPVACEIIRQAALGLQHAHEMGMVHRDVKPHNLMLAPQGQIKILDFGLARLAREQERKGEGQLTASGVVMGTADYIAPEQTRDAHQSDIRADIYSLGCTLYQLLSGRVPFPQGTVVDKMLRHSLDAPPSLASLRPDLRAELVAVVETMMAKEPAQRYQTPAEVAVALEPFSSEAAPPRRRRRWPLVAVAAGLLVLAVGLAAVVYHIQTDKGALVITTESDEVEVVIKQGGKVVRIIDTKTDKAVTLHSGVYELELQGGEGLKLDIDKATLTRGQTVLARIERVGKPAAPADASAVKVIQPLHRIPWGDGERFSSVDVTQDGRSFLAGRMNPSKVRVWDMQTGKLTCELDGWIGRFSPDGSHVIANGPDPREFHVCELPTGKLVRQFASPEQCYNFYLSRDGTRLHNITPSNHEIYDWATGKRLCRIPWCSTIRAVLTPDGRYLLGQPNEKPPLQVLDAATGKEVDAFRQLRDMPLLRAMSDDGSRLLSIQAHGEPRDTILDAASGKQVAEFEQGPWATLSGDGRLYLNSTNRRDDFGVWDVDSGQLLARLQFPERFASIFDRRVSRDGRYAVFAGPGDSVYVFRLPEPAAPGKP